MRITLACPEGLIEDANALLSVLGDGPADASTFGAAAWQDARGLSYALASWRDTGDFAARAGAALTAPAWPCDMAAALRAQEALTFGGAARAQAIVGVEGLAPQAAIQHLGVTLIETSQD